MFRLTEEEWNRSQFVICSLKGPINIQTFDNQPGNKDENDVQKVKIEGPAPNWSQIVTSSENSSQNVMGSKKNRNKSYLPYAFTEHGVTMLASVLKSQKAVKMSIEVSMTLSRTCSTKKPLKDIGKTAKGSDSNLSYELRATSFEQALYKSLAHGSQL
jgi:hypothetical protein